MAIPTTITDLSVTASSNGPSGSQSPGTLDDYIRAHGSIIRKLYNDVIDGTVTSAVATNATNATNATKLSNVTPTAAGLALIDDADAASQRATLGLGTAATANTGLSAGNVVILDGAAKIPAVDGSQLTGIIPTQTGNNGKFLTTNGSAASWGSVATGRKDSYGSGCYYGNPAYLAKSGAFTSAQYSGKIVAIPIQVTSAQLFAAISCYVRVLVSAKTIRLGIYADSDGQPGSLLYDAGTASFGTAGVKDISLGQTLSPGQYWLAFLTDATATGTVDGFLAPDSVYGDGTNSFGSAGVGLGKSDTTSASSSAYTCLRGTQAFGALPSTLPTMSASASPAPAIFLKV